jgi:hypothetical protein
VAPVSHVADSLSDPDRQKQFSAASFALAIADRIHFSIPRAARFLENLRIANAWFTSLPRIKSTTSRAFCAEPLKYFALAVASILNLVNRESSIVNRSCVKLS